MGWTSSLGERHKACKQNVGGKTSWIAVTWMSEDGVGR
jgi:hypothetical protein